MRVTEFAAYFDGRHVGSQMIALGGRAGALEIQLSRKPMVYLHAVQRKIALVGVRLRETAGGPLREIQALRVGQIILAGARCQTVGVKRCGAVTDSANLTGTRGRNVPSVPSRRENMLSAKQDAPDAIIGPTDLIVKTGWSTVTVQVVVDRVDPAVGIILEVRVKATDVN